MTKRFINNLEAGKYADRNGIDRRHVSGDKVTIPHIGGIVTCRSNRGCQGEFMRSWST